MSKSRFRILAFSLLFLAIAVTTALWGSLILIAKSAAHRFEKTVAESLGVDSPEFIDSFWSALADLSSLRVLINASGGARFWALIAIGVGVFYLLRFARFGSETVFDRVLFGSLFFLPAIAGLGMAPGIIGEGFSALAEIGLDSPRAIGACVGESLAPLTLGLIVGVLLVVAVCVRSSGRLDSLQRDSSRS